MTRKEALAKVLDQIEKQLASNAPVKGLVADVEGTSYKIESLDDWKGNWPLPSIKTKMQHDIRITCSAKTERVCYALVTLIQRCLAPAPSVPGIVNNAILIRTHEKTEVNDVHTRVDDYGCICDVEGGVEE